MGQTDGRTDGRTPDRYIDPAQHTVVSADNALHCRQRTEPRPERTYTEQFEKFGRAVFEICERIDIHTYRHVDRNSSASTV